jgi:hypothetical protein
LGLPDWSRTCAVDHQTDRPGHACERFTQQIDELHHDRGAHHLAEWPVRRRQGAQILKPARTGTPAFGEALHAGHEHPEQLGGVGRTLAAHEQRVARLRLAREQPGDMVEQRGRPLPASPTSSTFCDGDFAAAVEMYRWNSAITAVYPELRTELSLSVSDELDPDAITQVHWHDLATTSG